MGKFEYNARASVALPDAKKAQAVVYGVRALAGLTPVAVLACLIMFTPTYVWLPILIIIGVVGLFVLVMIYGPDILDAYDNYKRDYISARELGVRDE